MAPAQITLPDPAETLTWDLSDHQTDTGAIWTTAQFSTLPGARYTLASSPDLQTWSPLQSFYALGDHLHLALFEHTPPPADPNAPPPEQTDPADLPTSASLILKPTADGTAIAVSWPTLHEPSPTPFQQRLLPATLVLAWNQLPLYSNQHDH
ncbi:MAG: hypothetical protein AAGC74_13580, partial [Verrucomicrobiota bacterium]